MIDTVLLKAQGKKSLPLQLSVTCQLVWICTLSEPGFPYPIKQAVWEHLGGTSGSLGTGLSLGLHYGWIPSVIQSQGKGWEMVSGCFKVLRAGGDSEVSWKDGFHLTKDRDSGSEPLAAGRAGDRSRLCPHLPWGPHTLGVPYVFCVVRPTLLQLFRTLKKWLLGTLGPTLTRHWPLSRVLCAYTVIRKENTRPIIQIEVQIYQA